MTQNQNLINELKSAIRDVPDFPKKGILFKDITTLLADGRRFRKAVELISSPYDDARVTHVVGIEARGFILGSCMAHRWGVGFVPVRKKGKLPYRRIGESYALEYGTDTLEIHEDAVGSGDTIVVVDDLLATGGTAQAVLRLVRRLGARVAGCAFLVELGFLKGRGRLDGCPVHSVITY